MPCCEKCWSDSQVPYAKHDAYSKLVHERNATGHRCTPEQQAGRDAGMCPHCKRYSMHQHVRGVCMNENCISKVLPHSKESHA
jgi:hypothetical protein